MNLDMKCPICGCELPSNAQVCPVCGTVFYNQELNDNQINSNTGEDQITTELNENPYNSDFQNNINSDMECTTVDYSEHDDTYYNPQKNVMSHEEGQQPNKKGGKGPLVLISVLSVVAIIAVCSLVLVFYFSNKNQKKDKKENNTETSKELTEKNASESKTEESTAEVDTEENTDLAIDYSDVQTYEYDGFSFDMPKDWQDLVVVQDESGLGHFGYVSISLKSAYEDNMGGALCEICWKLEPDTEYEFPDYEKLSTGNGKQYVICYPTDVQFDGNNSQQKKEYEELSSHLSVIVDSFKITQASEDMQYVFPDSATKYLSNDELNQCSTMELRVAKNEIIARKGRVFEKDPFKDYFPSLSWYKGTISADDFDSMTGQYNAYEEKNIKLIKEKLGE